MEIKLISGTSNLPLASSVAKELGIKLIDANVQKFNDTEISVEINESVRGQDVFLLQTMSYPISDNIMELLIMLDTLKRASANSITVVAPYYAYGRQDRKAKPRTPITARLLADLLTAAGATRLLTFDLHAAQIQGFFNIPVDNLYSAPVFIKHIKNSIADLEDIMMVSPDIGGVGRTRYFASRLNVPMAIIDKRRDRPGQSEVVNIIGDVCNKTCIIFDDIVDSGGTLCNAAESLLGAGAKKVLAYGTHGVLSSGAIERITISKLAKLVVTDSISQDNKICDKLEVVSLANILAEAIKRVACNSSIADLFDSNI